MIRIPALLALGALCLSTSAPLPAQRPFSGAAEIEHRLHKLNELGTVLHIAAHPDDERTAVLAYFARGRHMRTAYLSLTRGEGGQNLIGSEQGAQLGIIRTQELLDARQIDGAEQFFTRAIDFGFTRTPEETLQKWGHDRILSDVVWTIRRYRPDVIINGFSGTPRDGHGQHQASAILSKEAFTAAADPTKFPEQLKYVQPWQAKRLVQAAGFGGFGFFLGPAAGPQGAQGGRGGRGSTPPPPSDGGSAEPAGPLAETGAFNPVLGYSYDELAVLSRSMHHSQGTGAMRRPGPGRTVFTVIGGPPAKDDLFEGIDTTWGRLPGGAPVGALFADAIRAYEPAHPEKALPFLVKARPMVAAMTDPLAKAKLIELDEAIAECSGLWIEAQAHQPETAPGANFNVTTTVLNRSSARISFDAARIEGIFNEDLPAKPAPLNYNQSVAVEFSRPVPANQPYTQPYWLVKTPTADVYQVDDQLLIGLADSPPAAQVRVRLNVDGAPIELVRPVHFRYADRALGERVRPAVIVPAVAVNLPSRVSLFPDSAARKVQVSVQANEANQEGELRLELPHGWKAEPAAQPFKLARIGEEEVVTFTVTPPAGEVTASLLAVARADGRDIANGTQVIAYPHIPSQALFPASSIKLVRSNIKVTARKIGYIMGPGDEMPDALRQFGLDVTLVSTSDLEQGDLSRFDTIVAGVRSYNVRADVRANQSRLMDYVKNGGTYIVQYQTGDSPDPNVRPTSNPTPSPQLIMGQNTAPVTTNLGPYPFAVPGGNKYRVTVEEAPVKFTSPDSPLLQYPNHIALKDFDGWVQERGLYFAAQWDPRYQTVISTQDPGEEPLSGGEIWTRYGKGVYIFTAFSWFRQLPAGVPGAWRLFANLLSVK
ncbi:MAG TPA: PIG-L family deacetylase [Verrucomicrobiae bacterium]|nr:PIG-L family deacetylase [Verrucomicrobiae bacterium]